MKPADPKAIEATIANFRDTTAEPADLHDDKAPRCPECVTRMVKSMPLGFYYCPAACCRGRRK